jgi:hypothetical protein
MELDSAEGPNHMDHNAQTFFDEATWSMAFDISDTSTTQHQPSPDVEVL